MNSILAQHDLGMMGKVHAKLTMLIPAVVTADARLAAERRPRCAVVVVPTETCPIVHHQCHHETHG
jgi:hypothetical protein